MKVFAPLITNKPQGSGLGLFIAHRYVGTWRPITYTAQKGEENAFHLTFPIGGNNSATRPQRPANAAGH
jgi:nitrogen-specific signal transduction histidine kinase